MKPANGIFWPVPITLSCERDLAGGIHLKEEGAPVPREFGRPEVIEILREYYASLG